MRPAVLIAVLAAAIPAPACDGDRGSAAWDEPVHLLVRVTDHRGLPLGGAGVIVDGAPPHATGEDGMVEIALSGPDGRLVDVELECPGDPAPSGNPRQQITLRRLLPVVPGGRRFAAVEIGFVCVPARREHLLVIRAHGRSGLPVLVNGRAAAETGPSGAAHVVISRSPGEEIEVVIDTSGDGSLRPRSPSRRLRLPEDPRIILFDQRFEERRAPGSRARRAVGLPRRL